MKEVFKKLTWGMVVGKFSPLHRGHEYLIRTALEACEELLILSWSRPEPPGCGGENRYRWLKRLFPRAHSLAVGTKGGLKVWVHRPHQGESSEWVDLVKSLGMPPGDLDDVGRHRHYTGDVFHRLTGRACDAVFTSEAYGEPWAQYLTGYFRGLGHASHRVLHIPVDPDRILFPVSGSGVRRDPIPHQKFIDPGVYRDLICRVALLGGESTGKTTLAQNLARRLETAWAPEFGRELWEKKNGQLLFEDMQSIAETQIAREEALSLKSKHFLFCDSTPLTTLFYSGALFGRIHPALRELAHRPYHVVFLCGDEFPFVQDGTRQDEGFRQRQQAWYRSELGERGVDFVELKGSLQAREDTAVHYLQDFWK